MNLTKMDKIKGLSAKEAARGMIRVAEILDEVKITIGETGTDGISTMVPVSIKMLSKKRINAKKARLARKVNSGIGEILKKRIKPVD